jgi:hypothetical protein
MEPLYKEKTKSTPEVNLDKSKEIFLIKGWSKPENTLEFYEPVMNWFTEYTNNPNPSTTLTIDMDYFNSSTSKVLLNIINILEVILKNGLEVKVTWHYGDEDTLEAGEAYKSLTKVPFTFIEQTSSI